jgi:thioredoxin reductase
MEEHHHSHEHHQDASKKTGASKTDAHHDHHKMDSEHKMHDHHDHHAHMVEDFKRRFWVCVGLTLPILLLSPMIQDLLGVDWNFKGDLYLLFALSCVLYFYGGWPFLKGLKDELTKKEPGMMTLIGVAISAAFIYSSAVVFGLEGKTFFWELATLIDVMLVGGGPAGIELAGALAEMRRYVLPKDFPEIDFERMNIYLFEAMDKLLGAMSEESSSSSLKYLNQLHVKVHLNAKVDAFDGTKVTLANGENFYSETVIWTAGVKANPIAGLPPDSLGGAQRIKVNEYNLIEGTQDIFAIGDVAVQITEENPRGLPMLAPVAMQQGKQLAQNLLRKARGEKLQPFKFKDKGVMATIGRNKAVVDLPKVKFQGTFAWFVWMFVHLLSLVGFRNKLVTIIGWTQNYFNYDRPLGLIIRKIKK